MPDPASQFHLRLYQTAEGVGCSIRSERPVHAARIFVGRSPTQVARTLPLLFSICAKAQSCASVAALEQAGGWSATDRTNALRQASVEAETLREHLWRVLLDWPLALDDAPQREPLSQALAVVKTLHQALDPDGRLFAPGIEANPPDLARAQDCLSTLRDLLERWLFAMPPERWLTEVFDHQTLTDWSARTVNPVGRLFHALLAEDAGRLGAAAFDPLPALNDAELIERLTNSEAENFIEQPTWRGAPRETGPLARHADGPLLRSVIAHQGAGLLARLIAQMFEIAVAHARLDRLLKGEEGASSVLAETLQPGIGIGRAEAARGALIHLARVAADQVRDYRILAPTEWNFHPNGVMARALVALARAEPDRLHPRAALLIAAIDPCIDYQLTIEHPLSCV